MGRQWEKETCSGRFKRQRLLSTCLPRQEGTWGTGRILKKQALLNFAQLTTLTPNSVVVSRVSSLPGRDRLSKFFQTVKGEVRGKEVIYYFVLFCFFNLLGLDFLQLKMVRVPK